MEPPALAEDRLVLLRRYQALLRGRAIPDGLVARSDRDRLWERHVLDSLRAEPCLGPGGGTVFDLGSGAGLPGIPLAVVRPDLTFVLIESRRRRAGFLEFALEDLQLSNASVSATRIEEVRGQADVCLARALSDLEGSWRLASPLLDPDGMLVYFAGRGWREASDAVRGGVASRICAAGKFPWQGPIVIMNRVR